VHVCSWRVAYRGLLPDEVSSKLSVLEREQFRTVILTHPVVRTSTIFATVADVVVGFALGPPLVPFDRPKTGDLYALYLDPALRRRGIGGQLHDAALFAVESTASPAPGCGSSTAGLGARSGGREHGLGA